MRMQSDLGMRLYTGTFSAPEMEHELKTADVVIGAIHAESGRTPCVVSEDMVKNMKTGAVIIDVSIDQGGCFETSKPTTHAEPIYEVDNVIHYCVANMPGAVARTSTIALGNATMPFMMALANKGWKQACADDKHLLNGLNVHAGKLTYAAVGEALGLPTVAAASVL